MDPKRPLDYIVNGPSGESSVGNMSVVIILAIAVMVIYGLTSLE